MVFNKELILDTFIMLCISTVICILNWEAFAIILIAITASEVMEFLMYYMGEEIKRMVDQYVMMVELEEGTYDIVEFDELDETIELGDEDIIGVLELVPEEDHHDESAI